MPTLAEIRQSLGADADGISDAELYSVVSKTFAPLYSDPKILQQELVGKTGQWGNRFGASIDSYQANLYGLGEAMGSSWAGERRRANENQADLSRAIAKEQGAVTSYKDVGGFGDALNYVGGLAVDSLPYLGEAMLGGGVGGLAARGLAMGAKGAAAARTVGGVAASYPSAVGDILSNQREENGQTDLGSAAALGVPYAGLNAFGLEGAAARFKPFRIGTDLLDNAQGIRGGVARAGVTAATTGFKEGLSETGQEFINQAGRNAVNPNAGYFGDAALERYGESFVGGAALGGVMGGGMGGWRRSEGYKPPVNDVPGQSTDLLNSENWGLSRGFDARTPAAPPALDLYDGLQTSLGAAPPQSEPGLDFSSAYPAVDEPPLFSASGRRGPEPMGGMPGVDLPPLVADQAGAVGANEADATALYGRNDGDLGVALARERYLEQQRLGAQRQQTAEAIKIKAQERTELAQRTKEATGVDGTRAMDLFADLERQQAAGLLSENDFVSDASMISTREFGKVAKNIKARDAAAQEQANATGARGNGNAGPADVGGGAGSQRAPGQPGGVQPAGPGAAAQTVAGTAAAELGTRGNGGDVALTPPVIGTKAKDAVARVEQVVGRDLTVEQKAKAQKLANMSPKAKAFVYDLLGLDKDGHQVADPMTLDAVATKHGTTRQNVSQVLGRLGITEAQLDAARATDMQSVSAEELGVTSTDRAEGAVAEATGFRVSDKAGAGADDFVLDARTVRDQKATDTAITAAGPEANAAVDATVGARKAVLDSEFDAKRTAVARANQARDESLRSGPPADLRAALAGDLQRGNVAEVDIEDGAAEWNDQKLDTDPTFEEIAAADPDLAAAWIRAYHHARNTAALQSEIIDDNARRNKGRAPVQGNQAARVGQAGGQEPATAADAAGTRRALPQAQPDAANEDLTWGDQGAQMSRATQRDGEATTHTAESLEDSLLSFMNADSLGKRVVIVDSASDLDAVEDLEASMDGEAVAWARNGKAYLIADRIEVGKERGVFLHEVGGHLGLQRLLGEAEFDRLVGKVVTWAARKDDSQEATLARAAVKRVNDAGTEGVQRNNELVAYFLEEAVNAGLNPTAVQYDTPVRQWLRTLWAAFKVGLRRLGIVNIDKLTAQDVVNLGYGAARLNLNGRFHGTAAKVNRFLTKYIGAGEGAQAYGWGMYFSELRGVAEDYKKSDVQRKSRGGVSAYETLVMGNGKPLPFTAMVYLKEDGVVDALRKPVANYTAVFADAVARHQAVLDGYAAEAAHVEELRRAREAASKQYRDAKWGSAERSDRKADYEAAKQAAAAANDAYYGKNSQKRIEKTGHSTGALQVYNAIMAGGGLSAPLAKPQVKGNLYTTELAVKDDELLDWVKPLDAQPRAVREMLERMDLLPYVSEDQIKDAGYETTGGGLYRYLEQMAQDNEGPFEQNFEIDDFITQMSDKYGWNTEGNTRSPGWKRSDLTQEEQAELARLRAESAAHRELERKSAPERVSKWLDSIGVKGVRMPANYTRGGSYDGGSNFVVFNEKNVIKAMDNPANRVERSVQFSKAVKPQAAEQLAAAQASITASLNPKAKSAWTDVRNFFRKHLPYLMTNFQLAEQFGGKIASLKAYVKTADLMRMETLRQQMEFDAVATRWDALPKAARVMLDELALRVTLKETHPDLAFDHKDNAHLKGRDGAQAEHAALAAKYKQMAASFPEAAKVYQDAKATLEASRDRMEAAADKLKDDYGIKRTVPEKMAGPYFPLMRFGEYLAIGESAQYKDVAAQLASAAGEARAELQKQLDKLKRDPKHYVVSAHESRSGMEAAVNKYAAQGLEARPDMSSQRLNALPKEVHTMVAELAMNMAGKFDGETANAVIDAYKELLVKSLPELHALNRAAQRKGVEGASPDMLRAFAASGRQNSFYAARLMYAKDAAEAMQDMKAEVKGNTDLQHVHRELEKRAALDLQFQDTPLQDLAGTAAWVYYLGASPTFLFMNMTQPWLVTGPVLAGKYGAAKSIKELGTASREALQVLKDARWKDGKWSPWEGISESSVKTTRKNAEGVSEDRKALRALMQRGIVDEGMQHELATFAEGGSRTLAKFGRWTGWASQQIELVNRTATALATFRLARANGMDYDAALEEAYRVTTNTQMDYSAEGTARFMRTGGGIPFAKLMFQFRRYQQTMMYVMADNIKKLGNPAERKVAAKSLAYFAMTSGMAAGAMGLPFAGSIMLLANAFMDDDDEEGKAEVRLRNLLFDLTGDRTMADTLAKGIPAAFGADLSQRIGMGSLAQLYPRLELNGRTGEENVGKLAGAIAGPAAGLGAQFFQAGIHFSNGDWVKGTEKMLPKFVADAVRAGRYSAEGMTDGKGETILGPDELGAWDKILRAVGTTGLKESNYYEATAAKRDVETAVNHRKSQIQREFRRALRSGDFEDVRAMIDEFNTDHPAARIKPKDELAWRRDARKAEAQRDDSGIKFNPKRDQAYGELQRFARG